MQAWWTELSSFEKMFWYIAIPFSAILLIQMIMTIVGMGGDSMDGDIGGDFDGDMDADIADGDGTFEESGHVYGADYASFDIFTVRSLIAFFTMFGWAGITGVRQEFSTGATILFATGLGLVMMFIISGLIYFISKLADNGTMDIRNALNQVGNVYIPIKANGGNVGKIQVNIQDSLREMQAMTKKDEDLSTGMVVKVTGILSGNILVVEKFNES